MSQSPLILSQAGDGILHLSFNRPQRRNALNGEMYVELARCIEAATDNTTIRCLLIDGANNYFTAGNDLEEFVEVPETLLAMRFFHALNNFGKPVVAAVEGAAIGIGTTALLHCDFAYAGASTRFSAPFIKLGVCPEGASSLLLPQLAGYKRAAEILLLGDPFTADTALEIGLLTAVVADGSASDSAWATARRLAALPVDALQTSKRLLKQSQQAAIAATVDGEEREFLRLLGLDAAQSAIRAFLQPRKA